MSPNPASAPTPSAPMPALPDTHVPNALVPVVPSEALLRGQKVVSIDHNGSLYRLQTTRQGKLILTK